MSNESAKTYFSTNVPAPAPEQNNSPAIITRTKLNAQSIANSIKLPEFITKNKNGWGPLDVSVSGYDHEEYGINYGSLNIRAGAQYLQNILTAIRAHKKPEAKIILVMGEVHEASSQIHLQAAVMHCNPGATLALELPYNDLADYSKQGYNCTVAQDTNYNLHHYDPLGHVFARAVMADNDYLAPLAFDTRLQAALSSNAPIILADMARTEDQEHLDPNGVLFEALVSERKEWQQAAKAGNIHFRSLAGMEMRNGCIATTTTHATHAENAPDLTIVTTGTSHFGNVLKGLSHAGSLPAQLANRNPDDIIVTVFPTMESHGITPERRLTDAFRNDPRIIPVTIRGLSQKRDFLCYDDSQRKTAETVRQSFIDACATPPPEPVYPDEEEVREELRSLIAECEDAHLG